MIIIPPKKYLTRQYKQFFFVTYFISINYYDVVSEHSGRKLLICDLQGNYDGEHKMFRFTDPVIHYHNTQKSTKKCVYGRTDKGQKGMHDFLRTHECSALCHLLTKGFRKPHKRGIQSEPTPIKVE